jgi:YegS/Rv2252/BmrU family lipid kinase
MDPRPSSPARRDATAPSAGHAFVVINPVGGKSNPAEVRRIVEATFARAGWSVTFYETSGTDDYSRLIEGAVADGATLVVAAGGDGTISLVAGPLVGRGVPLAVLPVGTANVFAQELGIPEDLPAAAELVVGRHALRQIDVMQIDAVVALLQVGVGLDSLMVRDTDRAAKRRFGRGAYLKTLWDHLRGHRAQRFTLVVDGERLRPMAWQVLVANAGTLGLRPLRWGPNIALDDGELDVCIVPGRTIATLARRLRAVVARRLRGADLVLYRKARRSVSITTDPPLPVQADGEIIGTTPVTITLLPRALPVVAPAAEPPVES